MVTMNIRNYVDDFRSKNLKSFNEVFFIEGDQDSHVVNSYGVIEAAIFQVTVLDRIGLQEFYGEDIDEIKFIPKLGSSLIVQDGGYAIKYRSNMKLGFICFFDEARKKKTMDEVLLKFVDGDLIGKTCVVNYSDILSVEFNEIGG